MVDFLEKDNDKLKSVLINRLFLDCVALLKLHNYKSSTSVKGYCILQNQDNFEVTKIQVIGEQILFDEKHIIESLSDLSEIIHNYHNLEYKKHPKLFNTMKRFDAKLKEHEELQEYWSEMIKEVNESLISVKIKKNKNC